MIRHPSRTKCGSRSMSQRSLKVPGSDSSGFSTRNVGFPVFRATNDHLTPAGKPAPPRPRRRLFVTSSTTSKGFILSAFSSGL